jgi:enediyne biosynthesis protein E3
MPSLAQRLFSIDAREAEFARRGFSCSDFAIQNRLENVGRVFLRGYHAALDAGNPAALAGELDQVTLEHRGFAYEGAAMALMLLDGLFPRRRLQQFLNGAGRAHIYMVHVGAGWACARLPWLRRRMERAISKSDPVLGWLVIDGFGFHQGYFHWPRAADPPAHLSEHARHVYYQGLGRSLWFVRGADPMNISRTIAAFDPQYQGDAWSGVGLACAYAGGLSAGSIEELRSCAASFQAPLAQGAAFAAGARFRAGNPAAHTEAACAVLCEVPARQAASLCDETFARIDLLRPCPYQHWRELLQEALALETPSRAQAEPALKN